MAINHTTTCVAGAVSTSTDDPTQIYLRLAISKLPRRVHSLRCGQGPIKAPQASGCPGTDANFVSDSTTDADFVSEYIYYTRMFACHRERRLLIFFKN